MAEDIEDCGVNVVKITVTQADEQKVVVVMKGTKTIVHHEGGYDLEDAADIEVKVTCRLMSTARRLGIDRVLAAKVFGLRQRDAILSDFQAKSRKLEV